MTIKSGGYAIFEAIQSEMRANPRLTIFFEGTARKAVSPTGKVIDLGKEFGETRVPPHAAIDEEWFAGAAAGMAMSGVPAIAVEPFMCPLRYFDLVFNQIGKLRHMTGGQASMPLVIWQDCAGRKPGYAGQHADAGQESLFAALPGLKVVVPSNPYDAKGLMIAAIRDPDPVIFYNYIGTHNVRIEVPDEPYEVKIGEANIVHSGTDLTIVGYGAAMVEINQAVSSLKSLGIKAEVIDPRSVKPLPIEPIIASVRKTGRLLAVDHGHETLCCATEIVARCAIACSGASFARLAFPDAPAPANKEMIEWMTPDAEKIVSAAKKMLAR